jgi:hypothetical protein
MAVVVVITAWPCGLRSVLSMPHSFAGGKSGCLASDEMRRGGREGAREFVCGRGGQPPRPEANLFFVHLVTLNLKVH